MTAPKGTAIISMASRDLSVRKDAKAYSEEVFEGQEPGGKATKIMGLSAWRGSFKRSGTTFQFVSWVDNDQGYVIVGLADKKFPLVTAQWVALFDKTIGEIRPLKSEETTLADSIRIRIQKATATTTYESLGKNAPLGSESVSALRVLNGQYGSTAEPAVGQTLKVLQ